MKYFGSAALNDAVKYESTATTWISTRGGAARSNASPRKARQFRSDRSAKKWLAANNPTPYATTLANGGTLTDAAIGALEKLTFTGTASTLGNNDASRFLSSLPKAAMDWGVSEDFSTVSPSGKGSVSSLTPSSGQSPAASVMPEKSVTLKSPSIDKTPSITAPVSTPTSDPLSVSSESTVAAAASETAKAAMAAWGSNWRAQSTLTPCGSCTGRACTVCSIRTGGSPAVGGQPSGYAQRVLEYFDPATATQEVVGKTSSTTGTATTSLVGKSATVNALAAGPSNTIVLENMKQGSPESEWLIGTADTSIEGYAAQFTLNHGQTVDFKINTDSKNYRIDIYRIGYYNGDGARKVGTINQSLTSAQIQPIPLFDPTTKLVDAGNWSVSASWNVPADAVSGIYFAKLTRLDGSGGANMIPFIVRDDENKSDITFQTSDTTWQAYNWWGGYNLYGGIDSAGRSGRASAVSYNRPIVSRDGGFSAGPQDYIFGAEYPAIRWLEQNGYDVNYISGIDTARSGEQLLNSKIFLSVGHDEYWSAEQRANVEAARDAGVNLSFWSGNEVYWQTRWEASIDGSGTPYKTLVSYKERWNNADTDVNGTTSTWRDPQFGSGKPENALTGTIFTVDSYRLDTITIPYDLSNFRFWSNTAVANVQPGQVYSLTKNLLGYEWDSDLDNGSRPAGLVALSSTSVDVNSLLLDYGSTTGAGTASHSLTMYRAPSGALVFGAGTVYWSWGLDSHHDNEVTPTDINVQQAMVNLFADMGVQPTTLVASLAAASQTTDHIAPTSTIVVPNSSQTYTAAQAIVITGTATDAGGGSIAVVEVSTDGGTTWHRATGFANWTYNWTPLAGGTYTIKSRAVDDSVNLETPGAGTTINVASVPTTSLFAPSDVPVVISNADSGFVNLGVRFTSSQSGTIVGIKFYKGVGDGGTHIGSLWSSTGTLLASATFTGETTSGWQTVTLSNPVSVAAGTTYMVSYNSQGQYASTNGYFSTAHSNGPLTAAAGNGYFTYGTGTVLPTTASNGTNYWVDVVFNPVNTVNEVPVGNNDSGFFVTQNTSLSIAASALLANDTDPNGDILSVTGVGAAAGGTVSFNAQTNIITFTPNAGYTGPASFGYAISDGRGGIGSAIVSMTVTAGGAGASLFSPSDTPTVLSDADTAPVNLGVRFVAATSGMITGVKYYKSANDTGTHTGSLWSSTGTLLASATFTNETASGWQTVTFANPVSIIAGTTYVASYHSNGHYASTPNYFAAAHTNGPLTAPANAGVYTYGGTNQFPDVSYGAANYWVDVVLNPGATANHAPVAANDAGFTTAQNTALAIGGAALLANDTDADGNALTITGVSAPTHGTVSYNAQTNIVTFTPTAGYSGAASFTYAISDGNGGTSSATVGLTVNAAPNHPPVAANDSGFTTTRNTALALGGAALLANDTDADGNVLTITGVSAPTNGTVAFNAQTNTVTFTPTTGYTGAASFTYAISDGNGGTASATVSLTVNAPVNQAPVAVNDTGLSTARNTALSIGGATLLANDTDANGDVLTITGVSGATNGTVAYNAQTNIVTFTPTAGYAGTAGFTYSISDGNGGTASANVSLTVTVPATGVSLFSPSDTPAALTDADSQQVNLGVKFVASSIGTISGIKYYKSANDTGTHTGSLWSSTGTLLATATFTNETGSGWQTVTFSNPVTIAAGTTYVASFHSNGHYTSTSNYFTTAKTNGPLTAPVNAGVYAYGNANAMPTTSYGAANYWVDVLFNAGVPANQAPVAVNDSGFYATQNTALSIGAASLLANDTDPDGNSLTITGVSGATNGTAAFNAQTNIVTFTPTAGYTGAASFTYAISDGNGGTASANVGLTVTAAANQAPVAANDTGFSTPQNTALAIGGAAILANDTDPNGDVLTITGVSAATNGTVAYNAQTNIVTFTPTTGYSGNAGFTYSISDGRGGTSSANVALSVVPPPTGVSLFAASATPATVTVNDPSSVELGMRFTASQNGTVTGVKFYKGPTNTGAHTGSLWTSTGTLLGSVTFTNETASGWQTASLNTPVSITAGTSYVVSYHTAGNYSASANYFDAPTTNGPLTAPSSATSGGNGLYAYGSNSAFPSGSYNSTNYWVDVVFNGQLGA